MSIFGEEGLSGCGGDQGLRTWDVDICAGAA